MIRNDTGPPFAELRKRRSRPMNFALWLQRAALRWPNSPALLEGDSLVATYADWYRQVKSLAYHLRENLGLNSGDRVGIFLPNQPEYLTLLYACWYAGAAVVPVNFKLHPKELVWILGDADTALLVTDLVHIDAVKQAMAEAGQNVPLLAVEDIGKITDGPALEGDPHGRNQADLCWLFYTSGTTGKPKGVMITFGNLQAMALSYMTDVDTVMQTDVALYAAPMSHGAGIYNFMHVLKGARHAVPKSGGFEPAEIIALAQSLTGVHMFAAPTMVTRLLEAAKESGYRGEGIRTIVYGGGPMYLADIDAALDWFGPRFVQIYGQGECPMAITALSREDLADRDHPRWQDRAASVGTAQSCVEVAIANADGALLPIGETGEVIVRGSPVMPGYWRNKPASDNALRNGWLWTGDVGHLDADGYLTLKDRSKDVIISGGTNIYPREVEETLLLHPSVSEVSVIGEADAEWGENVVAFVVGKSGEMPTIAELDAHCCAHIARFKRPKRYMFQSQLPKNNYGKVLKTELRAMLSRHEDEQ